MTDMFNRILGIQGEKRVYHLDKDQLTAEEYEQGQVIYDILWGDSGLVSALGPTWNLIHDPRFLKIEDAFIIDRDSVFGGDASSGKQYITYHNQFQLSSVADLEQYSEILGEGRHFRKQVLAMGLDPQTFHESGDTDIWDLIRQECPNYFTRGGAPNKEANRLYRLIRAELLALIDDYARLPYCNDWLDLESGSLANDKSEFSVFAEVDFLERALTLRSSLRSTALKVLNANGGVLRSMLGNVELTDVESDQVLQAIYTTPYDKLYTVPAKLAALIKEFQSKTYEQRVQSQCQDLRDKSRTFCDQLESGEIKPLVAVLDIIEAPKSEEEQLVKQLMDDPVKYETFMLLVDAEKNGDEITADKLRTLLFDQTETLDEKKLSQVKSDTLYSRVSSTIKSITLGPDNQ